MLNEVGLENISGRALSSADRYVQNEKDCQDIAAVQKLWDEANMAIEAMRNNMAAIRCAGKAEA